jgi:ATP-dependent protease ClpP protease subunit
LKLKRSAQLHGRYSLRNNEEDENQDQEDLSTSRQIGKNLFVNVKKSLCYDYHLDQPIGAKSEHRQLLQLLYNADANDTVRFFIGGPGGDTDTSLEIINAISCTDAAVVGILTGMAASAHSILALAMPTLQVCGRARLMIHNASLGSYGKLQEVISSVDASVKICHDLFKEFYTGFLSDDEMRDLFLGKDFYFESPEIMKRLKRRADLQKKINKEQVSRSLSGTVKR